MKKVFVSGCYDIIHAGHVEFFNQAKALGDYLIVCFASDEVLLKYKGRKSALPEEHKKFVLENIKAVDKVVKVVILIITPLILRMFFLLKNRIF